MNDLDDGVARWRRVADALRGGIADGSLVGQLPPEAELAERHGVNRHTVRRAIAMLAAEGILRAERGRGTFINSVAPRITYPIGARARFSENMTRQSLEPSGRLIGAEKVSASAGLAAKLSLSPGAPLFRLEHLAVVGGVPLSRSTSHFPAERFPEIVTAYAETGSITQALARSGLSDYRRLETKVSAMHVPPADAELLHCSHDAIILVSEAIDVDPSDTPIQHIRTRFLADRLDLVFTTPMG